MSVNVGGTDEVRELVAAGAISPVDKAIDRPVDSMSDREIAEEMLLHARMQRDVVTGLIEQIMASPLGNMIGGKGPSPFAAFMGR